MSWFDRDSRRRRTVAALTGMSATAALAVIGIGASAMGIPFAATPAREASGCRVGYSVMNQWRGGFGANLSVTNLGAPITSWQLSWTFATGQTVTRLWSGSYTQTGAQVTVTNASWDGRLATGASAGIGLNGVYTTANPVPSTFTLNGTTCTGAPTATPSATARRG